METKELTVIERASLALGAAEHELKLVELVKSSANILAVKNPDGRTEAHRAAMVLKTTRVDLEKSGKLAREDAQTFAKAVLVEQARLIQIISPEEDRLIALRDAFDAEEQARKDALIAAERARVDGIQKMIDRLKDYPRIILASDPAVISTALKEAMDEFEGWVPHEDDYSEFVPQATLAIADSMATMQGMYERALANEAEALRMQQEREAADLQAKKEREELEAAQAQLKRDQEAAAIELQKQRDQIEKERIEAARLAKIEADRLAAIRQKEDDERAVEVQRAKDFLEQENEKLNTQRAALEAKQALLMVANIPKCEEIHAVAEIPTQPVAGTHWVRHSGEPLDEISYEEAIYNAGRSIKVVNREQEAIQILMEHFDTTAEVIWDLIRSMVADADKGDV